MTGIDIPFVVHHDLKSNQLLRYVLVRGGLAGKVNVERLSCRSNRYHAAASVIEHCGGQQIFEGFEVISLRVTGAGGFYTIEK